MYNLLLGGAAGDGIETMSGLLEKMLKQSGCHLFTIRDFMSRVRGGHNFTQIRFGNQPLHAHRDTLDGIFAIDETTYQEHQPQLSYDGFILCDESLSIDDFRAIKLPLKAIATKLGNSKVISSVATGALLKLFNIPLDHTADIIKADLRADLAEINISALKMGYDLVDSNYDFPLTQTSEHLLVSGNTAIGLGAVAAGLRFYSAYPMSPSTSLLDFFNAHSRTMAIAVEQAEDEIAAINMAIGASYAGAPAMTGTSGGGFSLMVEALGFTGIAEIPLVTVDVQRPGPATGFPTRTEQSDLKFVISASQGEFPRMVIALRDHADCFYQTARSLALAKKYQLPVILLSDQYLADSTTTIPILDASEIVHFNEPEPPATTPDQPYQRYALTENGISPLSIPGKSQALVRVDSDEHDEWGQITESASLRNQMVEKRMNKLEGLKAELLEPEFWGADHCQSLLIGFGSTSGAIKEAVDILNQEQQNYGALIFGDIYPLPTERLQHFADQVVDIINVEQNATGQLAALIREETLICCKHSILKYDGRQLSVDDILTGIKNLKGGF
ncbi:2-oxoacid:acceptor oxidoreductase subunit alpha [Acetobacterium sp.]|uniref:2-oxoacid:acceptor oxidoreductase subunit alpha n=1 Tax=Acetobacterium sp. TaxID=1872094 RepID=UPI000CAEF5E9|nr:2-oxoacid:acceptor oxidoreductase subunit alpha [Acetobacterium sp.]MDO9492461.1 2-oxoacid:acceptor oxidoreductase subunit alpha [Acetobacterium sp.]PKM71412.1 MAG: 2-oxoacid:acceptor oxidoreductase subunit alpha [Firmicutes bacterium HGW-Firmicutes-17]